MPGSLPNDNVLLALDQVIQAINDQALNVNQTCTPQVNVSCGMGGTGGTPIGESVEEEGLSEPETPPTNYDTYKCKAANFIVDYIEKSCRSLETLTEMVTDFSQTGLQLIAALLAAPAILKALGLGALVLVIPEAAIVGIVAAVAALIMAGGAWAIMLLFGRLADEIDNDRENLVCGLYYATSANDAKEFLDGWFNDAIDVITVDPIPGVGDWTQEKIDIFQGHLINIVGYFKINNLLNKLFPQSDDDKQADIENYTSTIDCGTCDICGSGDPCNKTWSFSGSTEGWTETEETGNGGVASGYYSDGALKSDLDVDGPNSWAKVTWEYDLTSEIICAQASDTISVDIKTNGPYGGTVYDIIAWYWDDTSDAVYAIIENTDYQTYTLTLTQNKRIKWIFVVNRVSLGAGGGSKSVEMWNDNVVLTLAGSPDCPA